MTYALVASVSALLGCALALCIARSMRDRLVARLTSEHAVLQAARDLENRRLLQETARDYLVRRDAGRVGRVTDGMATKPGALARHLEDTGIAKKLPDPES